MKVICAIVFVFLSLNLFGQVDLDRTYYKNGQVQYEVYHSWKTIVQNNRIIRLGQTKHVNMWLQNGEQILKNGNGVYYRIVNPHYFNDKDEPILGYIDSLVYQMKDSIEQGDFSRYQSYNNSPFFLIEKGYYENGQKSGLWIIKDSIWNEYEETYYLHGEETGSFKSFYINGQLESEGQKNNSSKEGLWKYYDPNGNLISECSYKEGEKFGKFIEYFPNEKIKVIGNYIHVKKRLVVYVENPDPPYNLDKERRLIENIPAKDGEWKFYDETGKLIKTKKYKKKVVKE